MGGRVGGLAGGRPGGWVGVLIENKTNSAQLELELGLSLAKTIHDEKNKLLKCKKCDKVFPYKSSFTRHLKDQH